MENNLVVSNVQNLIIVIMHFTFFRQEMVLRDSNLVMGPVSLEQELHIRKMQE